MSRDEMIFALLTKIMLSKKDNKRELIHIKTREYMKMPLKELKHEYKKLIPEEIEFYRISTGLIKEAKKVNKSFDDIKYWEK